MQIRNIILIKVNWYIVQGEKMIKKLKLVSVLGIIFFLGCTDTDKDDFSKSAFITIMKDSPFGICETDKFKSFLKEEGMKNVITSEEKSNVNCQTYKKVNDNLECTIIYDNFTTKGSVTCVIGSDRLYPVSYFPINF